MAGSVSQATAKGNGKDKPFTGIMGCCGSISFLPLLKLGKQRKPAPCYERLDGLESGNNLIRLARLGSSRIARPRGERKDVLMKKMKKAYKQGLAMARQSAPHIAELFRGNHLLLQSIAGSPFTLTASRATLCNSSQLRRIPAVGTRQPYPCSLRQNCSSNAMK